MHARFGELLGQQVDLSRHDIHEILADQQSTRRRFGEIALAWGLCRPEHVWQALADQATGAEGIVIDLDEVGIDSQAVCELPGEIADRLSIIPLRSTGGLLLLATAAPTDERTAAQIRAATGKEPRFVRASAEQIRDAITAYYTDPTPPADPAV